MKDALKNRIAETCNVLFLLFTLFIGTLSDAQVSQPFEVLNDGVKKSGYEKFQKPVLIIHDCIRDLKLPGFQSETISVLRDPKSDMIYIKHKNVGAICNEARLVGPDDLRGQRCFRDIGASAPMSSLENQYPDYLINLRSKSGPTVGGCPAVVVHFDFRADACGRTPKAPAKVIKTGTPPRGQIKTPSSGAPNSNGNGRRTPPTGMPFGEFDDDSSIAQ